MTKDAKNLIVGLDIGTSKVVAVVAEVMSDGRHEVIGLGQHESKGLKKAWWSTSRPPWSPSSARWKRPS
jgi:cell division ATPase FtsA